ISGLSALYGLSLQDSFFDPRFWEQIQKHPTLVELSLTNCPIDGSTWKGLCGIENLRELDVTIPWDLGLLTPETRPKPAEHSWGVTPTDTETYELGPPIQPKGTYPAGDEWKPVANLRNLESLSFKNVLITEELTQALTALPHLRELSFNNFSFDEECLDHLASIPTLKYLTLYNTKVTAAELEAFREKRPDVEIDHDIEGILSDRRAKQLINAGP
ncbi:MAG TPA: hypothetical protein VMM56_08275, partial [Planctomycetaceae bacterium]|nr:hypothetical protein [Planctomycetaceae bacterium]